jgi:rubrerythrin
VKPNANEFAEELAFDMSHVYNGGQVGFQLQDSEASASFLFLSFSCPAKRRRLRMFSRRIFECVGCGKTWEVPYGKPKPECCPECGCFDVKRSLRGILFDQSIMADYILE